LLFVHIAGAAVWAGGGIVLTILALRLQGARDYTMLTGIYRQGSWLSSRIFTPVAVLVLVLGILLVIEGPWSFDQLWIVLGLIGFALTFATGIAIAKPRADAIARMIERDGVMTEEAAEATRRLFSITRVDYTIVFVVIADMALKPTADDVWALVTMAAVVLLVAAYVVFDPRLRSVHPVDETA
jgi:hypothetical protein